MHLICGVDADDLGRQQYLSYGLIDSIYTDDGWEKQY